MADVPEALHQRCDAPRVLYPLRTVLPPLGRAWFDPGLTLPG